MNAGHHIHFDIRRFARAADHDDVLAGAIESKLLEQIDKIGQNLVRFDDRQMMHRHQAQRPAVRGAGPNDERRRLGDRVRHVSDRAVVSVIEFIERDFVPESD